MIDFEAEFDRLAADLAVLDVACGAGTRVDWRLEALAAIRALDQVKGLRQRVADAQRVLAGDPRLRAHAFPDRPSSVCRSAVHCTLHREMIKPIVETCSPAQATVQLRVNRQRLTIYRIASQAPGLPNDPHST